MTLALRAFLVAISLAWTLPASAAVQTGLQLGNPDASPLTWLEPDAVEIVAASGVEVTEDEEGTIETSSIQVRYGPPIAGVATHYGTSYHGQRMGCAGQGNYSSYDPTIVAVGPGRYGEWPCGTQMLVSGPAGSALVTRRDSCPGCSASMVDLSEAANALICGDPPHTCRVVIEVVL